MTQGKPDDRPAIVAPSGTERGWQEKIARAKAARQDGNALRAGRPASFRSAIGRNR